MTNRLEELAATEAAEAQVCLLLRKYRVQKHYRASSAAKATRYAVYADDIGQVTDPARNSEARDAANRLTAKDIVTLLRGKDHG